MNKERVPLWEKYTLTISEATKYFNIGEKKLRLLLEDNPTANYIMTNGSRVLIKRKLFEQFIDSVGSL